MFDNLIESKARKQKRAGGVMFSAVLHAVLITAAVYGTLQAKDAIEKPKAEKVEFVEMKKKDEPPPPKEEPKPPPPDVDLSKKVTNEEDFSGKGTAGGIAKGVVGGTPQPVSDQPYFEFQVEKQVAQIPGSGSPRYPDMLRSANVEGEVLAQFVVDTTGRAEMNTFKTLKSSHDLFTNAVKAALVNMRFYPAEVGGRKVKQLVQMPFVFGLNK